MGRKRRASHRSGPRRRWQGLVWILPPLLAAMLCLPCLRFTFIWDDFEFLRRALEFHPLQLLPQAGHDFYRPVSREIYFGLVVLLGNKAFLSHLLNAGFLIVAVLVFMRFVTQIAGTRTALFAGALFVCLGQVPLLVAWVSGAQDLLAILFLALALLWRWEQREGPALVAAACALLSKETAAAFVPSLALLPWILGRRPYRITAGVLRYGLLLLAWAVIHPGLRELAASGLRQGATVYLGTESAQPPPLKLLRYLLVLFQVPLPDLAIEWPGFGWGLLAGGALIATVLVRVAPPEAPRSSEATLPSRRRVALLGLLFLIPPLVLSAWLVRHFLPYYTVVAGLGASLLLALPLARAPRPAAWGAVVAFLALGIAARGLVYPSPVATERNFRAASETLSAIESGFRSLHGRLPHGTQAITSVQVGGASGVYRQFFVEQPLPVWYSDPTITTLRAAAPRDTTRPEILFLVTPWLDVVEMDPETYQARSSGRMPEYVSAETAIRLYAMGTSASGETDRAVRILTGMPEYDAALANAHRRLASALLESDGRSREADSLRTGLPLLPTSYAAQAVCGYLSDAMGRPVGEGLLKAFAIAPGDTASMMAVVACLEERGSLARALEIARRLRDARPEHAAAIEAERRIEERVRTEAARSP